MYNFSKKDLLNLAWEKPILAQLEITSKCNQKCIFCYTGKKKETDNDLSLTQWKKIIKKLKNLGVRRLDFTGRESFLYHDFVKLLRWCKEQGFENKVNTNGTFDVANILDYVDEIIFSVHGLNKIHDQIVGKQGSFALIEKNIKKCSSSRVKVSINMSLLKSNFTQMNEVFEYFNSRYNIYKFAPSLPVNSLFGKDFEHLSIVLNKKIFKIYMDNLKKIPKSKLVLKHGFHSIFINDPLHYKDENDLLLPNCAAGKYKLIVDSDARVFPCNFFKSDEFLCGNILTENEKEIWFFGKGFLHFRNLILKEQIPKKCGFCIKKSRCFSGCRAWSESYNKGGFKNARDKRCKIGDAFIGSGNNH